MVETPNSQTQRQTEAGVSGQGGDWGGQASSGELCERKAWDHNRVKVQVLITMYGYLGHV